MPDYKLKPTNAAVYSAIYATHRVELCVHESFTDIEGAMHHLGNYKPKIDTRWGFKGADYPLIVCIATKENTEQKDYDYEYFLVEAVKPNDNELEEFIEYLDTRDSCKNSYQDFLSIRK